MFNNNTESIKTIISQVTDRCIQNQEFEIQQIDNQKKLILWIAGIAVGLEVFILNSITWESLSCFASLLYIFSGLTFSYYAFLALVAYQMITRLQGIDNKIKKSYNEQCSFLIGLLHSNPSTSELLFKDLESNKITSKITNLEYFGENTLLNNPIIIIAKRANSFIDRSASGVLITHFIISICLFCIRNKII